MGYDESFLRLNKKDMKYFVENIEKYKKAFNDFGSDIYCHVKLLKPLKFGVAYGYDVEEEDLPIGEYIWVGGERRGFLYAMQESPILWNMEYIDLNPTFVSNYDYDEIKRLQKDDSFAILTSVEELKNNNVKQE